VGSGTIVIDADPFVPHESPPQDGQHHQLQRDCGGKVADKAVLGGVHAVIRIKARAMGVPAGNSL
jgi:hypothetical protein